MKDATVDRSRINTWWAEAPDANIGIATGAVSGVDVLDIDRRHDGDETLFELERQHGEMPTTATAITQSGSAHLFFKHASGMKNLIGVLGSGLDFNTDGGYVVAAPSVGVSGTYSWVKELAFGQVELAPLPDWLLQLARTKAGTNGNGKGTAQPVADKIPQGERHRTLVSLAGSMRRRGCGFDEIFALLKTVNTQRCDPPFTEKAVCEVAKSICKYPPGQAPPTNGASRNHSTAVEIPKLLNLADLLALEVTPTEMLIESIQPSPGASLMVGAAKAGKTTVVVQMAIAVATGSALFKNHTAKQGAVMILEQDDPAGAASIKDIVMRANLRPGVPLYVQPRVPFCFGDQFLAWLRTQITEYSLRLAILDSYTALRGSRGAGADIVKVEREEMAALDMLAKETGCAIQILHHSSKGSATLDWSERGGGTYGMNAAVEALTYISRFPELNSGAPERLMRIRGRHFGDAEMVLRFQPETLDYALVIEGAAAAMYPVLLQIRHAFEDKHFTAKQFYQETGVARSTAFRHIERLSHAGSIRKTGYGEYILAVEL